MNSRERVAAAVDHREPDLVPIDLNGTIVTSLTRVAYNNLREYLHLPPDENEDELKRTFDIMMPGGGFVFFPTHNIQADVSPDRIDRMFETVMRIRKY